MTQGHREIVPPAAETTSARAVLRMVQDGLGMPWVPEAWEEMATRPEVASALWTRLQPMTATGAFLRESLALVSETFADLADQPGARAGVPLAEVDRRGILLELDALLYGDAQLLLLHTVLRLALREGVVGRPGLGSARPRSPYRRRVLEAVDESAAPADVQRLFEDVVETLNLPGVPVDVRVLAKWMPFLELAWERLKRWRSERTFFEACGTLEQWAEAAARRLSPEVSIDGRELRRALGDGPDGLEQLERMAALHSAAWSTVIVMDVFFRIEAAVHPELPARARDQGDAQRV